MNRFLAILNRYVYRYNGVGTAFTLPNTSRSRIGGGILFSLSFVPVFFAFAVVVTFAGCAVHQWPEPHEEEPLPEPKITVPLRLEYAPDFYVWEHRYDPLLGLVEEVNPSLDIFPEYPGTSSKYANILPTGVVQVYVRAYSLSNPSRCVAEQTFTRGLDGTIYDTDLEFGLPDYGTYEIVVWSQFLATSVASPFYNPSDFSKVSIIPENYNGNTDYRDGYRGRQRVNVIAEDTRRHVVSMKRPMGKFELITTDLSEFLDRETRNRGLSTRASADDYRVVISFPWYYPNSYSAMDDRLENATTGVAFETSMTVTGVSEASLGFEYVMLNNSSDGGVQAQVDVYRLDDGSRVAGSAIFTIPMRRNHHTVLRGAFLSMEGSGGVGIDPGFNGDHNIIW